MINCGKCQLVQLHIKCIYEAVKTNERTKAYKLKVVNRSLCRRTNITRKINSQRYQIVRALPVLHLQLTGEVKITALY